MLRLIGSYISARCQDTHFNVAVNFHVLKISRAVQCTKGNRNLSFGHYEGLWTALGPGPGPTE